MFFERVVEHEPYSVPVVSSVVLLLVKYATGQTGDVIILLLFLLPSDNVQHDLQH